MRGYWNTDALLSRGPLPPGGATGASAAGKPATFSQNLARQPRERYPRASQDNFSGGLLNT
eukprot:11628803-Heterocapsa_arctica.AAC.1